MGIDLTVRDQVSLFALMVVGRPVTNRELKELAGLGITAEVRRRVNETGTRIATTKRGTVHTHQLTSEGRRWCEAALTVGRPDGSKFPAGAMYALLDGVGQYLARSGTSFDDVFRPDVESWIRAIYAELTVRKGPGTAVLLSRVRPWLEGLSRETVDAVLDEMIEDPDVRLEAELPQRLLTDEDRDAAVDIAGERRHLLRIGEA